MSMYVEVWGGHWCPVLRRSFTEPGASLASSKRQWLTLQSAPHPQHKGLQACMWPSLALHVGSRNSNVGPHACAASTLIHWAVSPDQEIFLGFKCFPFDCFPQKTGTNDIWMVRVNCKSYRWRLAHNFVPSVAILYHTTATTRLLSLEKNNHFHLQTMPEAGHSGLHSYPSMWEVSRRILTSGWPGLSKKIINK